MLSLHKIFVLLFFVFVTVFCFAQKTKRDKIGTEENLTMETDTSKSPSLEYKQTEEELKAIEKDNELNKKPKKKAKKSKKTYFGIKTRPALIRQDNGNMEFFRIIPPTYLIPNVYQREIYYYDAKSDKIKIETFDNVAVKVKKGQPIFLLHGAYQEYKDGVLREEGFFYKGTKHDKWQAFDREDILLEKVNYDLGLLADSKVTYYDAAEKKVKEIIPILHGRKQGNYWFFYENGVLGIEGKYENNEKIGLWREFYENRQRKRDTQYTLQWHQAQEPKLLREWNEKGIQTYDADKGGKLK